MLDRPQSGERAVLVHIQFPGSDTAEDVAELTELAVSAGATPVDLLTTSRRAPDARYYIGSGKANALCEAIAASDAEVVIFNHPLAPAQERNLERLTQRRVLDRISLILDIFAQRASTFEGKLQVELAQLRHLSTRLIRGWSHLERQKGGIGLRGPGEKQLETDRRLINVRIRQIERRLEKVRTRRELSRRARKRAGAPVVSLVGYTNAGKSSLFNALTGAAAHARNRLFETLDPTLRRLEIPSAGEVVLADTVGFIKHLPHELVAAFRATLEETYSAELLLHVIDASAGDRESKRDQVNEVLAEIGAERVPQIEVFNKCDLLLNGSPGEDPPHGGGNGLDGGTARPCRVQVSARTGAGIETLKQAIDTHFATGLLRRRVRVPASASRLRALLFESGRVLSERVGENGDALMEIVIKPASLSRLCRSEGLEDFLLDGPA
ncbi:MAG TPA: ribosome rescue GTPase HflX [Gammaproteobacteria bacterium]|nr:ribosome rescue GTPase HflX [Gammaproteobacteria bacterium]